MKWLRRIAMALLAGFIAAYAAIRFVPFPAARYGDIPAAVILADREGAPLRVRLGAGDLDSRPLYRPDPEDWIVKAIVAAEDQRFWKHPGVDPLALARAITQNVTARKIVSGASTLSTQVIRLAEPRRRTLASKLMEAFRALQLERAESKEFILGQYLNRAPFGSNIVGIEAAARRYFGKGARDLSLAEAALLAGLPQSPSRLRPDRYPERAKKRQAYVLERMKACGFISESERAAALALPVAVRPAPYPFEAPHFCELAAGHAAASGKPLVRTTLDRRIQRIAEETLARHAESLSLTGARGGAVVILDVKTGALRALVGSPDYMGPNAGQVNAALAIRSPGSTLKPFAYALALDRGLLTPQSVLSDVPAIYRDYEPRNFDPGFRVLVTLRDALVLSLNMPAIDVERRIGQPVLYDRLRALGLSTINKPASHYGLGLVLGNAGVKLLELANAYACLARGGGYLPIRLLEDDPVCQPRALFSPEACWLVADMMSGDERAMDLTGHAADVRLPPLAWKTGTSAGLRDAWTIAYNPEYVIGIWIGNPDGSPAERLVGRTAAAPIAWEIFRRLYPDNDALWYARPAGIQSRRVCAKSGCPPGPECREHIDDWFISGVTRYQVCAAHKDSALARELAGRTGSKITTAPGPGVRIRTPAPDSVYRLFPNLSADAQRIPLEASGGSAGERFYWFVNDRYMGETPSGTPLYWTLEKGEFQIVCSDARGSSDRLRIFVE